MTLTTVGYHNQPDTFFGKLACGLCAMCGIFIITLPIPIVVSSFAVCYRSKLWRNEIATRKRLARGRKSFKEDILFNLATSSGMSGVRQESEVFRNMESAESEYDHLTVSQNKYVIDNMGTTPSHAKTSAVAQKWLRKCDHKGGDPNKLFVGNIK